MRDEAKGWKAVADRLVVKLRDSSVQFSSVQFSSVQFSSVQFSSVQFSCGDLRPLETGKSAGDTG